MIKISGTFSHILLKLRSPFMIIKLRGKSKSENTSFDFFLFNLSRKRKFRPDTLN